MYFNKNKTFCNYFKRKKILYFETGVYNVYQNIPLNIATPPCLGPVLMRTLPFGIILGFIKRGINMLADPKATVGENDAKFLPHPKH